MSTSTSMFLIIVLASLYLSTSRSEDTKPLSQLVLQQQSHSLPLSSIPTDLASQVETTESDDDAALDETINKIMKSRGLESQVAYRNLDEDYSSFGESLAKTLPINMKTKFSIPAAGVMIYKFTVPVSPGKLTFQIVLDQRMAYSVCLIKNAWAYPADPTCESLDSTDNYYEVVTADEAKPYASKKFALVILNFSGFDFSYDGSDGSEGSDGSGMSASYTPMSGYILASGLNTTGIIIGVCVGVGGAIILGLVIYFIIRARRRSHAVTTVKGAQTPQPNTTVVIVPQQGYPQQGYPQQGYPQPVVQTNSPIRGNTIIQTQLAYQPNGYQPQGQVNY